MNLTKLSIPVIAATSMMFAAGCDIDQTQEGALPDVDIRAEAGNLPKYELRKTEEGRMPSVDVDAHGGQMPKFDIDGPNVTVGKKKVTVEVPDVDVDISSKKKSFNVPTIDVDLPDDDNNLSRD